VGWRVVDDRGPTTRDGIARAGLGLCERRIVLIAHVSAEDVDALELPAKCAKRESRYEK
jgi:hypothetical protein